MPTDLNGLESVGDVLQGLRAFKPRFTFPQLFLTSINDAAVSTNVVVQVLYVKWYPPTWQNLWFTAERTGKAKGVGVIQINVSGLNIAADWCIIFVDTGYSHHTETGPAKRRATACRNAGCMLTAQRRQVEDRDRQRLWTHSTVPGLFCQQLQADQIPLSVMI